MNMTILALIGVGIMMFLGFPITVSLGLPSAIVLFIFRPVPLMNIHFVLVKGVEDYLLSAVPLFILCGNIMATGGIAKRLINFCNALVSHIRGGLGHVNIIVSLIFGGISGSSLADTAVFGTLLVPLMVDNKYPKDYACAVTLTSSILSVIIPPSILIIILGATVGQSIARLLIGGIIPGLIVSMSLVTLNFIISKKYKYGKKTSSFSLKKLLLESKDAAAAVVAPLILASGLLLGFTTPTECSAFAVFYSIVISRFLYRELNLQKLKEAITKSAEITGEMLFIVASARIFNWIMIWEKVPEKIIEIFLSITDDKTFFLFITVGLLIITGMFIEVVVAIILLGPMLYPIIIRLGIDPIHFGILMIMTLALGLTTPPFGCCLFSICRITNVPFVEVVRASIPFYFAIIFSIILCIFFPKLVTFLPCILFK